MATEVVVAEPKSLPQRVVTFYHDVMAEMRKVTWPDRPQVQSLSIGVIILSLLVGVIIWGLDLVLQLVLVRLPASLFG
ncbi:MAG: preprotein translocase subunit SecE [Gemmatimonadetes bacterium]|jgi:preprotein translocase subunit SecE|nr:preprotein translocase subunit SecE [Gemmatimonadota bacterium]